MVIYKLQCQCLVVAFFTVILHGQTTEEESGDTTDFVDISAPPNPLTWRTRLKVKSVCTTDKLVGVTLFVSTALDQGQYGRTFQKVWRCHGSEDSISLHIRRVRLPLADDIAFRPSMFNKNYTVVEDAKLVVWMVDDIIWWKVKDADRYHIHKWALSRKSYEVYLQPPYSRPYKTFRQSCVPWFWRLLQIPRLSDRDFCPVEQVTVPLLSFPAVFNGGMYGILRTVSPFTDPLLELERTQSFLSPRFSVEIWVYLVDFCPLAHLNAARACLIFAHISSTDGHLTPVLLVDNTGRIQLEGAGPDMYVAQKTVATLPRHQWVRILLSVQHRTWTLVWSYGKNHNATQVTHDRYQSDVFFNDAEGMFLLGGADARLGSFRGYMSHVKLYRGSALRLDQLRLPEGTDAMFQLDVGRREEQCRQFRQWFQRRVSFYTHKASIHRSKHFCANSYRELLLGPAANPQLHSCPRRPGILERDEKRVARFLRWAAMQDGHVSSDDEAAVAQRLLDTVMMSVEDHGLKDAHRHLALLEQSACLGNMDATFTLATFLNNGVGTTIQERKSLALLMQGVMHKHRLSTLGLGHCHAMGLDGVPFDKDVAYMYYKDVGDQTREDRDTHPENQVATELIRLMDEKTLDQQTDESGDLFMWLKHQAQQGVASAQLHLAHLYFWGSQGMQRNLQAARQFFQQGAAQGDSDSLYNLGLMDFLGRGGSEKNQTAGEERLRRAAEKKHPNAISALGWIALEREKNYSKAAAHFDEAFRLNVMDAGYYLGHMYQNGIYPNKSRDNDAAVYYYEWAAMRGHVIAALLFAHFQSKGTEKMPRNTDLAMEWARYIAEQNAVIGRLLRRGVQAYRQGNIPLAACYYLLSSEAGVEVASFNLAWLCEEYKEDVTATIGKECQWRHYNLTVQREDQFVDPYSYIKMGDYFWYGCQGQRNVSMAANYYAAAGRKKDPHALFNLAFMLEEGAVIPTSVWKSLRVKRKHYSDNVTLLMELYERCRESKKSEAFIPCSLALYRVWLSHLWDRYHVYIKSSTYVGCAVAVVGTICLLCHWLARCHHQHVQLYQL